MLPTFAVPPTGPRQGKLWGVTQLIFAHNGVEAHRIQVVKGGYSSIHTHRYKWNRFVLLSGRLAISIERPGGEADETVLTPGWATDVPPGVPHGFKALEASEALELYWTVLDANDIERGDSQGGVRDAEIEPPGV